MRVRVKLQLTFAEKAPGQSNPFELELSSGATVAEALERLGIPVTSPKVIMVNGRVAAAPRELKAGDELTVFPPLEGG